MSQIEPVGVWDDAGYWHPNPALDLPPEEQKKYNEDAGYTCSVRPSVKPGAFDA